MLILRKQYLPNSLSNNHRKLILFSSFVQCWERRGKSTIVGAGDHVVEQALTEKKSHWVEQVPFQNFTDKLFSVVENLC